MTSGNLTRVFEGRLDQIIRQRRRAVSLGAHMDVAAWVRSPVWAATAVRVWNRVHNTIGSDAWRP